MVNGFKQDPVDGVSFVSTFADSKAPEVKKTQYFDNNGSRGIYHDGWYACTFGPLVPWLPGAPGLANWDANKDQWELYNLSADFSQANDLAEKEPQRLAELQRVFDAQAKENKVYPLGAGIWLRLHPEGSHQDALHELDLRRDDHAHARVHRAGIRSREQPRHGRSRVWRQRLGRALRARRFLRRRHALHGQGKLNYEYNMMIIERYKAQTEVSFPPGKHLIEVETTFASKKPLSPAEVVIRVDGKEAARTTVQRTVPAAFTASETFDVGTDLGAPVALEYAERRPFKFDGKIAKVKVELK